MRIIDTHAHIFPPKVERVATEAIRTFYDIDEMRHAGSIEDLLASGERAGVTDYLVFSTATTPVQVPKINDFIISTCAGNGRFLGAGTLHRDFGDFEAEIDKLQRSGVQGVKFHPDFQKFNIDDELLMPMFAELQRRGMFVITHSGDYRYTYSHPERVARVAKLFPRLRVIAAHFGGWSQWEIARRELVLPNVYVDTSSTFGFGGIEPVLAGLKAFDDGHIFFGCDFPMWDHGEELDMLRSLRLPDSLLEGILYNNFAGFYALRL
ncbi:MAG: amidohydrolase family protein [Oscillospiraceae bacterium]|jgi:predicted TIM-barrel fold metal-dependent hydrolase|nr:amidohydrolase family protein [Oscillospiraceae bacterium]